MNTRIFLCMRHSTIINHIHDFFSVILVQLKSMGVEHTKGFQLHNIGIKKDAIPLPTTKL